MNTPFYSFLEDTTYRCYDAKDVEDDGRIDITDAINYLNAIFLDNKIKIPAPNMIEQDGKLIRDSALGIDTTSDNLPPCIGNDYVLEQ